MRGGTVVAMIPISTASTMVDHIPKHTPMEFAGDNSEDVNTHLNARR